MITILLELTVFILALIFVIDLLIGFRMTKSLFNRFTAKAEAMAEEIRDPVADATAAIRKITADKDNAIQLRKTLLVNIASLKARIAKAHKNISNFENLAVLAGKAGNADDVKQALQSKANAIDNVASLTAQLNSTQKQEDELELLIKNCDGLIEQANSKKEIISNQIQNDQFKARVASVLKANSGDAMSAIQRLEADAERFSAEAAAAEELAGENLTLDQKYAVKSTVSEDDVSKYLPKQ
jgi:phage shock protein A